MGEIDGAGGALGFSLQYLCTEGGTPRAWGWSWGEMLGTGLGGWMAEENGQWIKWGGQLNKEKAERLLTEKENEMRMKIDEAEREGDSFHQQVCQMKPRDKSLAEGAWCLPGSAPAPSVSCLRQPAR